MRNIGHLVSSYGTAALVVGMAVVFVWLLRPFLGPLGRVSLYDLALAGLLLLIPIGAWLAWRSSRRRGLLRAALRESEARAQSVLDTAVDGIITIDERGIIKSFNHAAERLFGYSAAEIIGQNVKILMPSPYRQEHDQYILNYLLTGQKKIIGIGREVVGQRKDGSTFPMDLAVSEVPLGDRRIFTGLVHDISERKRHEQELRQAIREAEGMRKEAETANRMKDEFLATLSHELRTPLNAIMGWARLMSSDDMDEETRKQAVEAIERNALAQARLIEDLLDVSRIISGKLRLEIRPLDLPGVVQAAIDSVHPAADAKQINLEMHLLWDGHKVMGDATRLQQVVWNLLSNAIKFTPRGGMVRVKLEDSDDHAQIIVSDTGKGISPEFLPYVFDRFRQADSTSTRTHGGLGLGLAIVRHMVEMHGGTVEAHSEGDGTGATFVVRLPVAPASVDKQSASHLSPIATARSSFDCSDKLKNIKALVVDDEPDACQLIKTVLEKCEARVQTASSAQEAVELLSRFKPDVLVTDIAMPGEDGYSLLNRVRSLPREQGGRTPMIALTAYARPEDRAKAMAAGFARHVSKPADPQELIETVADLARHPGE